MSRGKTLGGRPSHPRIEPPEMRIVARLTPRRLKMQLLQKRNLKSTEKNSQSTTVKRKKKH